MSQSADRVVDAHDPVVPGMLGRWWRQGARSAFLMRPDWSGLQTTPAIIACLVFVPLVLGLFVQRLDIEGPANFYWPALQSGWLTTAVSAWVCWLLVPHSRSDAAPLPPSAAALFGMLAAQALTIEAVLSLLFIPMGRTGVFSAEMLGRRGEWAAWLLGVGWIGAAQLVLVWRSGTRRWAPRVVATVLVAGMLAASQWFFPPRYWYPAPQPEAEAEPIRWTQELMELQPQVLAQKLQGLHPQRPGVADVYAITFAPYADEDVFLRESRMVAGVMQDRFDAGGRTIQLVNHRDTLREWPWATGLNLQRAIRRTAQLMNRDEDLLFIHLTSHGARAGSLAAEFWPLAIDPVTPQLLKTWLDEAGVRYRIVSVSACYSGSWIEPLADEGTLVMTAADAEHTSYGCGRGSELTFFGRAVFDEELRRTWSFEAAHAAARKTIDQRERDAGKSDGYSNPQIRVGLAVRERLVRLEAERAAAAR
jgi:hypothetical protein